MHILIGVNAIHHAGERRALAAARRTGDEHHAVSAGRDEINHHRRDMQRVRIGQAEGQDVYKRQVLYPSAFPKNADGRKPRVPRRFKPFADRANAQPNASSVAFFAEIVKDLRKEWR